jgi:hypothetical protein
MQLTDNAGANDEHRALNYMAMRYPAIYAKAGLCMELKIAVPAVHLMPLRRLRAASEKSSTASTIREGLT